MAKNTSNGAFDINNRRAWVVTIILALLGFYLFLKPYISIILLATLLSYLTNPIYKRLLKKFKGSTGKAATVTTIILMLIIAIPLIVISVLAFNQAASLIDDLNLGNLFNEDTNIESSIANFTNEINSLIEDWVGIKEAISSEGIVNFIETTLPNVLQALTAAMLSIVQGIPTFFMNLIIFLFVYVGLLTNSKRLVDTLHYLSPFGKKVNDLYFKRIGIMASAMLKGQLFIAFLQGLATAIALSIVGFSQFFAFFLVLFTFMSFIPLGAGIITIPLGILALLTGNVWQGLVILGNHFIFVTNIDNIRPKLVPEEARMQASLTILSAFAGVAMFGLLGVIYGPIIMIVIVTTIELYVEETKRYEKAKGLNPKI